MVYVLLLAGIVLLIVGAEMLVRGASRLAMSFGISPLVVGLTVVAFGTSSPEFAVSIEAVYAGQGSIALGNVVGSNIFNVLFILGVTALIVPLTVSRQLIRLDVPLLIVLSGLVFVLGLDGSYGRVDGLMLFGMLVAYIGFLLWTGRRAHTSAETPAVLLPASAGREATWWWNVLLVVLGLVMLVVGSRWLVDGAVTIATLLGVSDLVIGLTIIAAGTSLPEVVTSVIASLRGERDIAVGNVVGSNLFNLMGVLGVAAALAPGGIDVAPAVITFDLPVMIAVAFACLPVFFTGGRISRWEGAVLLAYYVAYTLYLIFAATSHDALQMFGSTMLYFVIPITALTLFVLVLRAVRGVQIDDEAAS
ncbi:MAG: calcium/sodium antiporter [Rhodothermales bacterium]